MNDSHYNKNLKDYARKNRNFGTVGEAILWKRILRARKQGYQFNRQYPIDNYIVDFICRKLKLIIEIDGSSHFSAEQAEKDYKREQFLKSLGYEILRFTESEVRYQLDFVAANIQNVIYSLENKE